MRLTSLGDYDIVRPLATGATATVYLARQRSVNRLVALKVLHPHLETDQRVIRYFRSEKETAASLDHHNIVKVWGAYEHPPPYYIAFDYLPKGSLAGRIQHRPMNVREALRVLRPLCEALDYAHQHSRRVVHRDVKPSNILFNEHDEPVLTDFGIARTDDRTRITVAGARFGTAEYMSPEQAKGLDVDWRSDLYSLGTVCYHMLTGRPPFVHQDPMVVMRQIIEDPVPSARRFNPSVPPGVERVLVRALHKLPSQRYQRAEVFYRDLLRAVAAAPPVVFPPRARKKIREYPDRNAGAVRPANDDIPPTRLDLEPAEGKTAAEPPSPEPQAEPPVLPRRPERRRPVKGAAQHGIWPSIRLRVTREQAIRMVAVGAGIVTLILLAMVLPGMLRRQGPAPGNPLGPGSKAVAKERKGPVEPPPPPPTPRTRPIKPFINMTLGEAQDWILSEGYSNTKVEQLGEDFSDTIGVDRIIRQDLGSDGSGNWIVKVWLSKGPRVISGDTVPPVVGKSKDVAITMLHAKGLKHKTVVAQTPDPNKRYLTVLRTSPPAGARVEPNSRIILYVNVWYKMPSLLSQDYRDESKLRQRLEGLGSRPESIAVVHKSSPRPPGVVIAQSPAMRTEVGPYSPVEITISSGPGREPRTPARDAETTTGTTVTSTSSTVGTGTQQPYERPVSSRPTQQPRPSAVKPGTLVVTVWGQPLMSTKEAPPKAMLVVSDAAEKTYPAMPRKAGRYTVFTAADLPPGRYRIEFVSINDTEYRYGVQRVTIRAGSPTAVMVYLLSDTFYDWEGIDK